MAFQQGLKRKRIVLIGLGRQGWAIGKQLVKLASESPGYEIIAHDINSERVVQSFSMDDGGGDLEGKGIHQAMREGWMRRLAIDDNDPAALRTAIIGLEPDLIINAAVFKNHDF